MSASESICVSGGADSVLHIWTDCTEEELTAQKLEKAELIIKEQDFMNYYHKKDYKNAVYLALALKSSQKLLRLLKELDKSLDKDLHSVTGSTEMDFILSHLNKDELATLFSFIRDWNTHFKDALIAQTILQINYCDKIFKTNHFIYS